MKEILKFMHREWIKLHCKHLCIRCKYYKECIDLFTE